MSSLSSPAPRLSLRLCAFVGFVFVLLMTAAAQAAEPDYSVPVATLEAAIASGRIPKEVVDVARRKKEVAVMVELNIGGAFVAEPLLSNASIDLQRQSIARVQSLVASQIAGQTPKPPKRMRFTPYMALWGDERTLVSLVKAKEVRRVRLDRLLAPQLVDSGRFQGVLPTQRGLGVLGSGQTIAILDTGVDRNHTFFGGRVVSEACYSDDGGWITSLEATCPNGSDEQMGVGAAMPCGFGGCDHGTHVAGIAAGNGSAMAGVANNANIIAINVFHRQNDPEVCDEIDPPCLLASTSSVVLGLERVYELRQQFDIAAVNMSLGSGLYTSRAVCDNDNSDYRDAVANLTGANIAVVASAGNDGAVMDSMQRVIGYNLGIGRPACVSGVVSVGAVDNSDRLADWSQFGSLLTMLAVGNSVESSLPGGTFGYKGGTSMSAPQVAGAFAVLSALDPSASAVSLRDRLITTGTAVTDTRMVPNLVRARLQLDAAVENQLARPLSVSGVTAPAFGNTGTSLRIQWQDNARSEVSFRVRATPVANSLVPPRVVSANGQNLTTLTLTNLTPAVAYDVIVEACNASGQCSVGSGMRVTTLNIYPTAPSQVRACNVTTTSITLCWDIQSANPVTGYRVGHNTQSNRSWTSVDLVGIGNRSRTFTNLQPNTRYDFWVRSLNGTFASAPSNFGIQTLSLGPPPAAPANLHVCGTQGLELACVGIGIGTHFAWSDLANNETYYEFQWSRALVGVPANQAVWITEPQLPANTRSYRLGLSSGGLYGFRVRACNLGGCSGFSNTLQLTAP